MSSESVPRFAASAVDPKPLGEPLEFPFSKRTAPNRFLKAALSEKLSSFDKDDVQSRGIPSPELVNVYRRWGEGGWGQILTGNIMIDPVNMEGPRCAVIPGDAPFEGPRFEAFRQIATAAKGKGSLIVAQVSHAGRQVTEALQPHPISASPIQLVTSALGGTYAKPRAATREDLDTVIEGFAHAAEYLEKAGYDGIQLHGAHGYLLAQFLSLSTNERTDEYGGSLENRMRLILEIAGAIKKRVSSSFILGIKVNSVEFQDKGFTPEEAVLLCQALERAEFDYVETSGGTYESLGFKHAKESTKKRENFFIDFAARMAEPLSKTKVYTTGGFKTVWGLTESLKSVDGVGFGKAATQEPALPNDILAGRVAGVMQYVLREDEMAQHMACSIYQIHQLGKGEEPVKLTTREAVDETMEALKALPLT
ncbi:NADH oxidase [Xylariomycetidae sp. FL2044]|nr:NADH oxidase [Xylariomycetidae sp. FL2044]